MSELPAELVEDVARQAGEKHRPARVEIRTVHPRPRRELFATEDEWWAAGRAEVFVPSPGADGSTMVTFRVEDGFSLRSLTWREVTADVLAIAAPLIAAKERERIAAALDAQYGRHQIDGRPAWRNPYAEGWDDALENAEQIVRGEER